MTHPARRQREGGVRNAAHAHDTWKELAGRENEGLEVFLLWNKSADRLKLVVADARLDEEFEFAGAQALAAFYHPFAYAARRSVDFACAMRESLALQAQN